MSLAAAIAADQDAADATRAAWRFVRYAASACAHCGRVRVQVFANGRRVCEKCAWDADTGGYATGMPEWR